MLQNAVSPALFRLVRPHHWVKNLLLLVPLVTSHRVADACAVINELRAIATMCLVASAIYIVNDLIDLSGDRMHRSKRFRPLAAGNVSVRSALVLAGILIFAGGLSAASLSKTFASWVSIYAAVAILYSLRLKRLPGVDVLVLALLYTLRILLGAVAIAVPLSPWLLLFSVSLFLSLALLKRYAELDDATRKQTRLGPGRGYQLSDQRGIGRFGALAGGLATLVIILFVNSADVAAHYSSPQVLWALAPLLAYWLGRTWLVAIRGHMHDDPIVYALRDPTSYAVVAAMAGLTYLAV